MTVSSPAAMHTCKHRFFTPSTQAWHPQSATKHHSVCVQQLSAARSFSMFKSGSVFNVQNSNVRSNSMTTYHTPSASTCGSSNTLNPHQRYCHSMTHTARVIYLYSSLALCDTATLDGYISDITGLITQEINSYETYG
jgi:hypothetical protein